MDWLRRHIPALLADALLAGALLVPAWVDYLRWPLAALYLVLSIGVVRKLLDNRWIVWIVRTPLTRVTHGLEHATIEVLVEDGWPAIHGFTHAGNRFMVALGVEARGQEGVVREAATSAIRRIAAGEHAIAYQPGCGTSEVVFSVTLWCVYVATAAVSMIVGGSTVVWFALGVIAFRIWLAWERPLGLLAQRLFTVSTSFVAAEVTAVTERRRLAGRTCPDDEAWFEVVVDVRLASRGGLVSPGALA